MHIKGHAERRFDGHGGGGETNHCRELRSEARSPTRGNGDRFIGSGKLHPRKRELHQVERASPGIRLHGGGVVRKKGVRVMRRRTKKNQVALPLAGGNATLAVAEPPTREYVPMSRPEASMGSLR